MSVSVQTDIFCDVEGDNCLVWAYGGPSAKKARIQEARGYVKKDGWTLEYDRETNTWKDVCPNCLKESK